jgi:hypothetical protein
MESKMTKLTKSQKAARLDAFLSNDDNFVAIEYNDPRAIAIRAASAKLHAKKTSVKALRTEDNIKTASSFEIGQTVRTARREIGMISAIEGQNISVLIGGNVRKFNVSGIIAI